MKKSAKTSLWDKNRGTVRTRKGGWVIGEAVYNHGYSMMDDLVGEKTFFQVLVLNVTGRLPEKSLADWIEASFICLSWPDSRIWCNHIGSLAGTVRCAPSAAICAGSLAADSRMYGAGTLVPGTEFILKAMQEYKSGKSVEEIVQAELDGKLQTSNSKPVIVGYARPIATGDERVEAMNRVAVKLNLEAGEHVKLAFEVDAYMMNYHNEGMNMVGYCTAFLVDYGFSATEIYRLYSLWVNNGVHACYSEAADNPTESFLPLRCDDILYTGKPVRKL